jgi:hypothetical protein
VILKRNGKNVFYIVTRLCLNESENCVFQMRCAGSILKAVLTDNGDPELEPLCLSMSSKSRDGLN